jgi:trans-aconitate methyltransferase
MISNVWQPDFYDTKLGFVAQYGKEVVKLLAPEPGERILDLGCGTGELSNEIAGQGAKVIGLDYSSEMIAKAKVKYPALNFVVGHAQNFTFDEPFEAVFSNAALHWVPEAEETAACIWNALKPGGRFVAEFGGKANVGEIVKAISEVIADDFGRDADKLNPWYFPSLGEYASLLERQGFRVLFASHFDRPTPLADGEHGIFHWLAGFAGNSFLASFGEDEKKHIYEKVADRAKQSLFQDGIWMADYKRIRIAAVKPA